MLPIILLTSHSAVPETRDIRREIGFDNGKAGFIASVRHLVCPYRVLAVFAVPGEKIEFKVLQTDEGKGKFEFSKTAGTMGEEGRQQWIWHAPWKPGLYQAWITELPSGREMRFNIFVMVPFSQMKKGYIGSYRIGEYPVKPYKNMSIYMPPAGFVEVTPENLDTPVSPHFTLGQFLCKQQSDYPKYLVLRTKLLLKLEMILEKVNNAGYPCSTFHVMSGYRTPYYNKSLGGAMYSRHVWGGAADIFIDEDPKDDWMDDLNKDGRMDYRDARIIYDLADGMYGTEAWEPYMGGLSRYRKTDVHGPFVHVDVRGFRSRWGE
jgi:hypothetical protein